MKDVRSWNGGGEVDMTCPCVEVSVDVQVLEYS